MQYNWRAEITPENLDILFLSNYGRKNPSPVIDVVVDDIDKIKRHEKLSDDELNKLAELLLMYYRPKWDKLGEVYDIEYDPIHNYLDQWSDESIEDRDLNGESSTKQLDNLDQTNSYKGNVKNDSSETTEYGRDETTTDKNRTSTTTYGKGTALTYNNLRESESGTINDSGNNSTNNQVYGFNSINAVNSDSSSGTNGNIRTIDTNKTTTGSTNETLSGSDNTVLTGATEKKMGGSDTVNINGSQTMENTNTLTGNNSRDVDSNSKEKEHDVRERSGKHSGNIGNLTSQKQIQEEIDLWKWNYVNTILTDARNLLCLSTYLNF